MEAMQQQDVQQMEGLLMQMNVPNTQVVKVAEVQIRAAIRDKACVPVLLQLLRFSAHVSVRQLGAVLLRLRVSQFWLELDPPTREAAKRLLLEALAAEPERIVSLSTTYVVSAISKKEMENGVAGWTELLEFLQRFAQSTDPHQQELAMRLFYALTETVGTVFQPHFADLKQLYSSVLHQSRDTRVRIAALKAAGALIEFLSSGEDVLMFRELVPLILVGLESNMDDEALAIQMLEVVTQLAESPVPILNKHVKQVLHVLVVIIRSESVDLGTKRVAIDTLRAVLACKSRFVAKLGAVDALVETAVMCLAWDYPRFKQVLAEQELTQQQIDEMNETGKGDDEDDDDEQLCDFGQSVVAAIASHLSPRLVFQPLVSQAVSRLQSPGVVERDGVPAQWIGLSLLIHATEGLNEQLVDHIEDLLKLVVPIAQSSPDPTNRATALMCMAEWIEHLAPPIFNYISAMLPPAIALLGDPSSNLVRSCAGDVIELICDDIDEGLVMPFLDELATKLLALCEGGPNASLRSTALSALCSLMVTTGPMYMPYFDTTCAVLGKLLLITEETQLQVRGHATAALGNLAIAASRETPDGANNLARFRPLIPDLLSSAVKGLEFEDMELNRLTYSMLSNLADAFGEEIACHVEAMLEILIASQYLDEDAQLNVKDPDGALVPQSVKSKFESGDGPQVEDASRGAEDGDEDPADETAYQPGVRYEICLRSEVIEAKQSALYALGRVVENAPANLVSARLEEVLQCCLKAFDHVHPKLKSVAVESAAAVTLAFARCHPLPSLDPETQRLAEEWADACYCEFDEDRRWVPGVPARTALAAPLSRLLHEVVNPRLLSLIVEDKEKQVVAACCSALESFVAHLGPAALGGAFERVVETTLVLAKDEAVCQWLEAQGGADADAEADGAANGSRGGYQEGEDDAEEEDDRHTYQLFDNTCDLLAMLAMASGPTFGPYVAPIFEALAERMHRGPKRRAATLGAFVQVVVSLGPRGAEPFAKQLLPIAISCLNEEHAITRRNAAFLIGNLVALGGPDVHSDAQALFQVLQAMEPLLAEAGDAQALAEELADEAEPSFELMDLQAVVDNACGAVARIFTVGCASGAIPADQVFPSLLPLLPLRFDLSENFAVFKCVHSLLRDSTSRPCVLANAPALVSVCARTLVAIQDGDQGPQRLALRELSRVMHDLLASQSKSAVVGAVNGLPPDQASALGALMRGSQ